MISNRALALPLLLSLLCGGLAAQERYIDDTIYVPLRSGEGSNYRILHKGLKSGTRVALVEENGESGWSLVRTAGGVEGWLQSRYLSAEVGAQERLTLAEQRIELMDSENRPLLEQIDLLTQERNALAAEAAGLRDHNAELEAEIIEVKQISSSALQLDRSNKQLAEQAEMMKNRIEVLGADNGRLRDEQWQKWFIYGVYATGMGGLLTLLLPRLLQRRRRHSEWA